jgi:hypothetical protein
MTEGVKSCSNPTAQIQFLIYSLIKSAVNPFSHIRDSFPREALIIICIVESEIKNIPLTLDPIKNLSVRG